MPDHDNWLLSHRLRLLWEDACRSDDPAARAGAWAAMERALSEAGADEDADIALPVLERSEEEVERVFEGWRSGRLHLPEWDRAVLKRALKAYRKRLKLARLDEESSSSRNPLSKGSASGILGVRPPEQYPPEVWAMLVAQGKLRDAGHGLLELATA